MKSIVFVLLLGVAISAPAQTAKVELADLLTKFITVAPAMRM